MFDPSVFSPYLHQLAVTDPTDVQGVEHALTGLAKSLRIAVHSYHGLRLTLVDQGHPVSLIEFSDDNPESMTSLRVDLAALVLRVDPASRIVLYAGARGAFVDLAADLHHVYRESAGTRRDPTGSSHAGDGAASMIELDADLPPVSTVSGVVGLTEFSTINRAIGLLIGRGLLHDAAHDALCVGAAAANVEKHVFAALLLGR